jgi:hypothetical protein
MVFLEHKILVAVVVAVAAAVDMPVVPVVLES